MSSVHIDCFSTGLEDLPVKKKRDPYTVYDTIMAQGGRFSTFDIDKHSAGPVTMLFQRGYIKEKEPRSGYPWHNVEATEAGRKWRAEPPQEILK